MLLAACGAELQPVRPTAADFGKWLRPAQAVPIR
jgi:hypothetical protein